MPNKKQVHNSGKEFEEIVAIIHEQFSNGATITKNEFIKGKSGVERQIDIAIKTSVSGYPLLVIIECKDYGKRKVEVGEVDELIGKMDDVEAHKAVLVSNSGFTTGALERAKNDKRVDLSSVIDLKNKKLRAKLKIPFLAHLDYPETFSLRVTSTGPSINTSLPQIEQIKFYKLWNQGTLNMEPGDHTYDDVIEDGPGGKVVVTMLYSVKRDSYFKEVLLEDSVGIYNHKTNGYTTKSFTLEPISFDAIKTWKKVAQDNLPLVAMQLVGKSGFPEEITKNEIDLQ